MVGSSVLSNPGNVIAAVDLGSNSFHMVVATLRHGQLTIIDRLRETVRLAEGLTVEHGLAEASKERALAALALFGDRLRHMQASSIRAAGTNTLRRAGDDQEFLEQAEAALGHPIEIISGIEEARLVYLGVAHSLPPTDGKRLVMDIGGGSTELILGQGFDSKAMESLSMGAVMISESFFPGGVLTRERFEEARTLVQLKLRPVKSFFRVDSATEVIGTSGTILASHRMCRELGLLEAGAVTPAALDALIERVLAAGHISELQIAGLSMRRAEVISGGLAILSELLNTLRIQRLHISDGALREGLLYDLVGRIGSEDARVSTVAAMVRRYHIDMAQAERIALTAESLRLQVAKQWDLDTEQARMLLCWAAYLHEVGFDIAHNDFHLHGAYIVANADMPGFPAIEQRMLAALIASQRKQFNSKATRLLPDARQQMVRRLTVLLRLSILLHRSRANTRLPNVHLEVEANAITLQFPSGWLNETPLTGADLEREARLLGLSDVRLRFR